MARLEILPFDDGAVEEAGRLLAARHARHRSALPLLSPRYEDATTCRSEVASAWSRPAASGAVARRDGTMVGYLLGSEKGDVWGRNIWVESAGQATDDAEVMRELYAVAGRRWYDEGRTAHYVVVPAQEAHLVDAWFRLCFGLQQVHGIQPTPGVPGQAHGDGAGTGRAGPVVRRAVRADIPVLARLDVALPEHQAGAPVFSAGEVRSLEEAQAEWESDFDDEDFANFVVEADGAVVGAAVACALEKSGSHLGPARPDNAGFLGFAAVLPEARGRGAGRALADTVLTWSRAQRFDCVVTDWRSTNLEASRAWTGSGFGPSFYRLHRLLGQ